MQNIQRKKSGTFLLWSDGHTGGSMPFRNDTNFNFFFLPEPPEYVRRNSATATLFGFQMSTLLYVLPGTTSKILRSFMCHVWISAKTAIISLYSIQCVQNVLRPGN